MRRYYNFPANCGLRFWLDWILPRWIAVRVVVIAFGADTVPSVRPPKAKGSSGTRPISPSSAPATLRSDDGEGERADVGRDTEVDYLPVNDVFACRE